MRDVSITQALHEGGIGPIPIGVIGSPETSHADHGFMTLVLLVSQSVVDLLEVKPSGLRCDTKVIRRWSYDKAHVRVLHSPCRRHGCRHGQDH